MVGRLTTYSLHAYLSVQLSQHRFLFLGAGEAGVGIADLLSTAIVKQAGTYQCYSAAVRTYDPIAIIYPSDLSVLSRVFFGSSEAADLVRRQPRFGH
jgi:malic enzyme